MVIDIASFPLLRSTIHLLVASLSLPLPLLSQAPLSPQREFILSTPGLGVANAVIELSGGGFAAVGYADFGRRTGTDVVLVRFDAAGDTLWTRSYGGDREEVGWDVVESPDGGFFLVGYTEAPTEGREDILVLRVDASGEPVWEQTFGEAGRDRAWSATTDGGGGIVIAAESENVERGGRDAYVMRVDGGGEVEWSSRVDAPGDQRVFHVARTDDGAFVVTGTTAAEGETNRDVYVVRLNAEGGVVWTRSFGGEADDVGHGIMALGDGEVLVTGYGASRSAGGSDVYVLRLSASGDLRWWRHDAGPEANRAMMSAPRPGGGYVSVGFNINSTGSDVVVLERDADGSLRTRAVIERAGNDRGVMIVAPRSGGYVVAGTVGGDRLSGRDFAVLWLAGAGASIRQ